MILDGLLLFDTAAALNTGRASTNVIDLLNARDIGIGDDPAMKIAAYVTSSFTSTNAATVTIQAQGSTDNSAWTTYAESRDFAIAELQSGYGLGNIDWPTVPRGAAMPRYLRLNYVIGTGAVGSGTVAGAITAMLVLDRQNAPTYPPGIRINN